MSFQDHYTFRAQLTDSLLRDLVGPGTDDEVISDPPITKYIAGILYPQSQLTVNQTNIDQTRDEDEAADDDTGIADPPVALANIRFPSSMGLTFAVDTRLCGEINVVIEAARYYAVIVDEAAGRPRRFRRRTAPGATEEWRREPLRPEPLRIPVKVPVDSKRAQVADGLEVFWRVRPVSADGAASVTIVLLNARRASTTELRDSDAFFQPRISITVDGAAPVFVERPSVAPPAADEDLQAYRLLYRHARAFAIGHGSSVEWDVSPVDPAHATSIRTTFVPAHDVRVSDSNPNIQAKCLEMRYLAAAPKTDVLPELDRFCSGYQKWISERDTELSALSQDLRDVAASHLRGCAGALSRMAKAAGVLGEDETAWQAFRLMNRAMLQQRARTEWLRTQQQGASPVEDDRHKWRPFQLAFILLCLDGIVHKESPDRALADLLWFPTAGGKTEAYLGLIAFTIFLRRLRFADSGAGVTAIMRYTLRLLTLQQFERAALLICCCEQIRQANDRALGVRPISVGLWVGQDATPNSIRDAKTSLNNLRKGAQVAKRNPVQLHSCPWCGTRLDYQNYSVIDDGLLVACRHRGCFFEKGLPVYVVDEDIYRQRPALIIATVDKFASLPWRDDVSTLFNLDDMCSHPPDLVIQDELHLISGPLGTLTALYETAVDALCSRDGAGPKVVASTATIRRARAQVAGLFNRDVRQFPPPGLDARDSYFALEAPPETRATRLYLGVMAPGTSQATLLVRTYACLLQKTAELAGSPEVKDPYWTLVGYFNSLRVLGGARMQVQDDVSDRIKMLAREDGAAERSIDPRIELTSRTPSGEIPQYLKQMSVSYPDPDAFNVILATNMISVGVDIERFGLMVVMGQPPSASEYIQSTSRVGRRYPGLVVVLFNAAKSRDRSHYESFVAYHSALHRQVESASVTPFSPRARDRGLHAVIVAMARHLVQRLRPNDGAAEIGLALSELRGILDSILRRISMIAPEELEMSKKELEEILAFWEERAKLDQHLVYRDNDLHNALLRDASIEDLGDESGYPTLWSLRDVDRASGLYLVR